MFRIFNLQSHPLLLALPLLALLFFIARPFHIDDTLFLETARRLPWNFVDNQKDDLLFLGQNFAQLSPFESTHPVLIPYFLKFLGLFQNEHQTRFWLFHLAFLIFPALALYMTRSWCRFQDLDPLWGLFLLSSPLFFVNATSLMTDVPMLSLWLSSLFFAVAFAHSQLPRHGWALTCSLLISLLIGYQSICLFPLIAAYWLIHGVRFRHLLLFTGTALLLFALYLYAVYLVSGYFPFINSSSHLNIASEVQSGFGLRLHKTISVLSNLGLGLGFFTPLLFWTRTRLQFALILLFATLLAFSAFYFAHSRQFFQNYTAGEQVFLLALVWLGALWLVQVTASSLEGLILLPKQRTQAAALLLPGLWFLGVFTYNVLFMPYGIARYILPALPAALYLLFLQHQRLPAWRNLLLIPMLLLSLFMAMVDYRQADADWQVAKALKAMKVDPWYSDDAGLRFYLNRDRYLLAEQTDLPAGEYLLFTRGLIHDKIRENLSLIRSFEVPSFGGFSLFNTAAKAGFYRSLDGLLPFNRVAYCKTLSLYQVNPIFKNLEAARKVAPTPDYIGMRLIEWPMGQWQAGLFMHPDAYLSYPLETKGPARFSGRCITIPDAWKDEGDGVQFQVGIESSKGEKLLWEHYTDGKSKPEDRQFKSFEVEIPAEAAAIWLRVSAGPKGNYQYDGSLWTNLAIEPVQEKKP